MDGFDTFAALARSPVRLRVLGHLLEDGPATASEIEPAVAASRRTVSRSLAALEEEGLAAADGRRYGATTYAELVADDVFGLVESLSAERDRAAFLEAFPEDAIGADLRTAAGRAVKRSDARPHAPTSRAIEAMASADRLAIVSPVASSLLVEPLIERVAAGARVDAVVSTGAYEASCVRLRTGIRLAATLGAASVAAREEVPFGLVHAGDRAVLGAYDEGGLCATFDTGDEAVCRAAMEAFRSYRADGEVVIG